MFKGSSAGVVFLTLLAQLVGAVAVVVVLAALGGCNAATSPMLLWVLGGAATGVVVAEVLWRFVRWVGERSLRNAALARVCPCSSCVERRGGGA